MSIDSKSFKELLEAQEEQTHTKVPEEDLNALQELTGPLKEAIDTTPNSLAPTVLEKRILEGVLLGLGVEQLAIKLGIPATHIRTYVRDPKVKAYLKEVKEALNEIDQLMITSTLRKIVGARIEELGEDESYASLTKKDTLDVIRAFSDITNQIAKAQVEEKSDDIFVNIYQQILER